MKNRVLYCILTLVVFIGNYSFSQTYPLQKILHECSELYKRGKEANKVIQYLNQERETLKIIELYSIYDSLIQTAQKNEDYNGCYDFIMGKIDLGYDDVMLLENPLGVVFRLHYPEKYQQLEQAVNKKFVEKSLKYFPDINLELAFTIRHLFRYDQRTKIATYAGNDKKTIDSLRVLAIQQDSITEKVLKNIFDTYGYPGLSLVGTVTNDIYIIMLHLGTDFQIEYIHLVQEAIINKELQVEIDILADKILHKCCNKTIYGTIWSKYSPLTTDPDEVKKLKELLRIL